MAGRKPSRGELRDRLDKLGSTIATRRDEAVAARKESGIEEIWAACEEAYLGIDDANRHEFAGAKWAKPATMQGPVSTDGAQVDSNRSTAFVRLTSRYVDFGAAKLAEIALPIDDKAFSFEPTPVPELVQPLQQAAPAPQAAALPATAIPGQVAQPVDGGAQQMDAQAMEDAILEQARESAKKAEKRIYDWMVEGRHQAEMRKVIDDSARIGVGVLKGPIPEKRKQQAVVKDASGVALQISMKIAPVTKQVDPDNCFPAPGCGENIHDGDYFIERDYLSPKKLRGLKRRRPWSADQIDKVLKEGPGKIFVTGDSGDDKEKKYRFELWHYYGLLTRDELEAASVASIPDDCEEAYAIVTLVNDSVVRCVLNPLDSGRFPYNVFPWSRRAGHWAGVGVGEQVAMPQRMVNASTRAMLENAGLSAGVQIILDQGSVTPADKIWEITRNKLWFKAADAVIDDVKKAFHIFDLPSMQDKLMPIIEYGMRLAEEHSSIPLVSMGQYAEGGSPQTFGQAELQNSNANALLRDKGSNLDDCITEPLVQMFYEWLLLDPDVPAEEKGDFKINAHGTSAMVERAIQEMTIIQAVQMSANPAFGADPKKVFALWLKTKRINPKEVQYTEEEMAGMAQNQPSDPRLEAAQISADSRIKAAQIAAQAGVKKEDMRSRVAMQRAIMDTDRDAAYVQELRERSRVASMTRIEEARLRKEIAMLDYANKRNISVDQIRAKLATKRAELITQKELAASTPIPPQVASPPTEPPGRAPAGQAYQR